MDVDICPYCSKRLQITKCKVKGYYWRHFKGDKCVRAGYTVDELMSEG